VQVVRENHSSRMKYRVRTGRAHTAGEARYDSPEAVSCGVPPKERAASAGRRRTHFCLKSRILCVLWFVGDIGSDCSGCCWLSRAVRPRASDRCARTW
jgi:hypothetical protein